MVDATYQPKVYKTSDGDKLVIASGGEVDFESGSSMKLAGTALTPTAAQVNLLVQGYAAGYKIARGIKVATANGAINTGLASIVAFAVCAFADTATKINVARAITAKKSGATLTVYRWKHTAPSTCTLTAATTAGTVDWMAVGT